MNIKTSFYVDVNVADGRVRIPESAISRCNCTLIFYNMLKLVAKFNGYILLMIVVFMSLQSCKNSHTIPQLPDTLHIGYNEFIKTIIDKNCVKCHATGNTSGYVNLDSYENVKPYAVNGNLYGSIQHLDGSVAMPIGAPKLDSNDLFLVRKWIDDGILP